MCCLNVYLENAQSTDLLHCEDLLSIFLGERQLVSGTDTKILRLWGDDSLGKSDLQDEVHQQNEQTEEFYAFRGTAGQFRDRLPGPGVGRPHER